MDGVPLNGAGHIQHQPQQHNPVSPFDSNLHHHQQQQHPYYHQQQQYTPTPYASAPQQQQHYYHQAPNEQAPDPQQQQYYSNHQAAWGNANNLQSYSYYNQQPQTYHHHHQQQHQQQVPPPQQHPQQQQQEESLANLSRFVNQPSVSTTQGMSMPQQRGPSASGSMGRPGPGSSPAASAYQLMPVRLQNVKGARTKAGMRKLIQEQNQAATQIQDSSVPPAKKKKVPRNSVDEAIEATLIGMPVQSPLTSEPEPGVAPKKKRGRKKKSEETSTASRPPIILKLKKGTGKRLEAEAAQLLHNPKQIPPAKVEPKMMRRSLSKEKKVNSEQESRKQLGLHEHEHKIIRKEMVPGPSSDVHRPKSKAKSKAFSQPASPQQRPSVLESSYEEAKESDSESPNSQRTRKVRRKNAATPRVKVELSPPPPKMRKERKSRKSKSMEQNLPPEILIDIDTDYELESESNVDAPSPVPKPGRKPRTRKKSASKGKLAAVVKKRGSQELVADSESSNPAPIPMATRPKPSIGLLDRRPLIPQRLRTPTVKRVGASIKPTTPQVPIVGPSLKVKHGVVKFYRGSDEEEVDEPLKKLAPSREQPAKSTDENQKKPWMCVFCNLGPHNVALGDLFGPYYVQSTKNGIPYRRETWVHSDCAIWAGDVMLVGETLRNLDAAVEEADDINCKICSRSGATIGCCKKGCTETCHYPCAKLNGWNLNENTYHSYCRVHSAMAFTS